MREILELRSPESSRPEQFIRSLRIQVSRGKLGDSLHVLMYQVVIDTERDEVHSTPMHSNVIGASHGDHSRKSRNVLECDTFYPAVQRKTMEGRKFSSSATERSEKPLRFPAISVVSRTWRQRMSYPLHASTFEEILKFTGVSLHTSFSLCKAIDFMKIS